MSAGLSYFQQTETNSETESFLSLLKKSNNIDTTKFPINLMSRDVFQLIFPWHSTVSEVEISTIKNPTINEKSPHYHFNKIEKKPFFWLELT